MSRLTMNFTVPSSGYEIDVRPQVAARPEPTAGPVRCFATVDHVVTPA
jgi:hypothetical protein